jgi:TRAP-type C4-dicarboxylate transport system permease small subunit
MIVSRTVRRISFLIEVLLPVVIFSALFIVFLANVFFRYILRNPQNWTFEFSVNAFAVVSLLSACTAHRTEDHVVFDLLYTHVSDKTRNIMRIISSVIVIVLFSAALPGTFRYLQKLPALTSIMNIPFRFLFLPFPILLLSMVIRSLCRLKLDVEAFLRKTYVQTYNTGDPVGREDQTEGDTLK